MRRLLRHYPKLHLPLGEHLRELHTKPKTVRLPLFAKHRERAKLQLPPQLREWRPSRSRPSSLKRCKKS